MTGHHSHRSRVARLGVAAAVAAGGLLAVSAPAQAAPALKWSRRLPGVVVRNSSPTPASLDGQSSIRVGFVKSTVPFVNRYRLPLYVISPRSTSA